MIEKDDHFDFIYVLNLSNNHTVIRVPEDQRGFDSRYLHRQASGVTLDLHI